MHYRRGNHSSDDGNGETGGDQAFLGSLMRVVAPIGLLAKPIGTEAGTSDRCYLGCPNFKSDTEKSRVVEGQRILLALCPAIVTRPNYNGTENCCQSTSNEGRERSSTGVMAVSPSAGMVRAGQLRTETLLIQVIGLQLRDILTHLLEEDLVAQNHGGSVNQRYLWEGR